jgi:PAS domain S-box-containing protein
MTTAAHSPPQTEENPAEAPELSGNEADAFRRIREALARTGARFADAARVEVEAEAEGAVSADSKRPPPIAAPAFDETLLDRLSLGLAIFRERRILLANRTLLDLLGFDSVAAFAAAGGVEAIFIDGTRLWAGADFDDRDGRLAVRTRGGAIVPVEARLNTVTFAGETAFMLSVAPRPVPVEAAVVDATAAERRIHDLETILNTATDGVLTLDRHGAIMSMNRAAEALFAVEAGDFKGRPFTELLAEESHRTALDYLDGLAANGVASVLNDGREVIGRVPHGGLIPLYMSMGRLGDSGRFSAVLRDITHWKTIEEELTAARREAEAANAQKSEFLAKISHEIRTPLNAIIGFSEIMMEQRFGPVENDRYRAYLKDIHVSGQHLISLINDLLDLSKIEAGKVELTFEAVAVNAVIQEGVALMQPLANRERIIIRTSLSTDLPNVVADQRSFRQILLNLLSNAIKFTRAGGQVIVSTLLEESGEVVVRIRDTGIGMSAAEIETAMKPFEQVAIARGDRDKGTGLGLPLTKAMVEANRAAFAIESAPNQGTLVRVTFPTTRVLAG